MFPGCGGGVCVGGSLANPSPTGLGVPIAIAIPVPTAAWEPHRGGPLGLIRRTGVGFAAAEGTRQSTGQPGAIPVGLCHAVPHRAVPCHRPGRVLPPRAVPACSRAVRVLSFIYFFLYFSSLPLPLRLLMPLWLGC